MLSEVPDGWIKCSLGEVLSLEYGKSLPEKARIAGQYPVYGSAGRVGTHNEYLVESQSIVVGRKGTVGAIYKTSQPFFPIDTTYYVVVKNETNWDWLTALLESLQLAKLNEATGVPGLNRERAYATEVCIPPLNEQQRIAEVLSSVDASIQATQAVIDQAERVKRGLMEELLTGGLGSAAIERGEVPEGWNAIPFEQLAKLQNGFPFKSANFLDDESVGLPIIRIRDLEKQSPVKFYDGDVPNEYIVEKGDVLIGMDGNFDCVEWKAEKGALNQRVIRVYETDKAVRKFLLYRLVPLLKELEEKISGTTVKHLSIKHLKALTIPTPPLTEQEQIADILASVDDVVAKHRATIGQKKRIKQGLMDDLLTGKVRTV